MNHELECFYTGERDDDEWRDAEDDPCICDIILNVRADEREKAARRVIDVEAVGLCHPCAYDKAAFVAAARGEDKE